MPTVDANRMALSAYHPFRIPRAAWPESSAAEWSRFPVDTSVTKAFASCVDTAISPKSRGSARHSIAVQSCQETEIETVASRIQHYALSIREPTACGLLALQLAHGPSWRLADEMIAVMEESFELNHLPSRQQNPTLVSALLSLAKRKRGGELAAGIESIVEHTLTSYLCAEGVTERPGPAAVLGLLTTVVPSHSLARESHHWLRHALPSHVEKQDSDRAALAILGASPFLRETDLDKALALISYSTYSSAEMSVESLSYRLMAVCFAKERYPRRATTVATRLIPPLLSALFRVSRPFAICSVDVDTPVGGVHQAKARPALRQSALALCALHQAHVVDLTTSTSESSKELIEHGS